MDIVERLNEMIGNGEYYEPEFEQAKAEIERLREALNKWWEYSQTDHEDHAKMMLDWADAVEATRSALQQKESV